VLRLVSIHIKGYSLFIFLLIAVNANAQVNDDVYFKPEKSQNNSGNSLVSKYGIYFSLGLGASQINSLSQNVSKEDDVGYILSSSFAYKSHVATVTYTGSGSGSGLEEQSSFSNSYVAFLVGESLRQKDCFISLSVGVANSEMSYRNVIQPYQYEDYFFKGISYPIELKDFIAANRTIGFGIHMYENLNR
jgi:hypothetical protein